MAETEMHTVFIREYERKRSLGRFRRASEDNFKMNLTEIVCERVGWI
jgi:hypothetical protein